MSMLLAKTICSGVATPLKAAAVEGSEDSNGPNLQK